jgi:hypothetical protein
MVLPPRVRSSYPSALPGALLVEAYPPRLYGGRLHRVCSRGALFSSAPRVLSEAPRALLAACGSRAEVRVLGFEAPDKGFVSGRPTAVVLGVWDVARSAYQHPNPPVFVALVGMVLALMCFLSTSTSTPSASTASFTKKPADRCLAGNPCPFLHRHNLLAVRTRRIYFTPDTLHASRLTPPPSTSPRPRAPRPCPS